MNLKDVLRARIIEKVLKTNLKDDWHVLVYNKPTASILTHIFTKTEILSNEILSMQRLEASRDALEYPAIYFIRHCKDTSRTIRKDVKNRMYTKYYIVHVNEIEEKEKIVDDNVFYKYVDIGFVVIGERIFTKLDDFGRALRSFSATLKLQYNTVNLRADKTLFDDLNRHGDRRGFAGSLDNTDLLLLDRSFDLITPLIHFFDFECLLHDMNLGKDMPRDTDLYEEIRYLHIADTNKVLNEKAVSLVQEFSKIDDKTNITEIRKMVLEAPENIKLKSSVNTFINLAEESLNMFERDEINSIAELEQDISTGYDNKGNHYHNGIKDVFYMLKRNIKREYKIRLVLLLLSTHYDLQNNEIKKLKDDLLLTDKELRAFDKLKKMRTSFNKRKEYNSKYIYDISRYDPLIHDLLRAFVQKKNNRFSKLVKKEASDRKESLRKSCFVFKKYETKKKIMVIFIDVITYPEIMLVNKMSAKSSYEIFVCTDRVVNPKEYVEWLETTEL